MNGSGDERAAALERPFVSRRARVGASSGEDSLVRAAKRGSPEATEALIRRHWDGAHRAAFLIVQDAAAAEDIAQEAMLAAVRSIGSFDRRRPFGAWLHRIVANRSIDWLRARERRSEVVVSHVAGAVDEASPDRRTAVSDELVAALATLEPEQRATVVLRHLLDYRSSEIARMLDIPAATVRTGLRRSLERLRAILENRGARIP